MKMVPKGFVEMEKGFDIEAIKFEEVIIKSENESSPEDNVYVNI